LVFDGKWFGKLALTIFRIGAMLALLITWSGQRGKIRIPDFGLPLLNFGWRYRQCHWQHFLWRVPEHAPMESPTRWFHARSLTCCIFPCLVSRYRSGSLRGGTTSVFFDPVFNIADSSIFIGVASILSTSKKVFPPSGRRRRSGAKSDLPLNHVTHENPSVILYRIKGNESWTGNHGWAMTLSASTKKRSRYEHFFRKLESLVSGEPDLMANLSKKHCGALKQTFIFSGWILLVKDAIPGGPPPEVVRRAGPQNWCWDLFKDRSPVTDGIGKGVCERVGKRREPSLYRT